MPRVPAEYKTHFYDKCNHQGSGTPRTRRYASVAANEGRVLVDHGSVVCLIATAVSLRDGFVRKPSSYDIIWINAYDYRSTVGYR